VNKDKRIMASGSIHPHAFIVLRNIVYVVGSSVFPGLVKISRGQLLPSGGTGESVQTVVRRAQVICFCAVASGDRRPEATPSSGAF